MSCPYLRKDVIYVCNSSGEPVIPGVKRIKSSCKCGGYVKCPDYQAGLRYSGMFGFSIAS